MTADFLSSAERLGLLRQTAEPGGKRPRILGDTGMVRRDPLGFFASLATKPDPIIPLRIGFARMFFVNHPSLVERVLQSNAANYRKSRFVRRLTPMLGEGFVTSDGPTWRRQRLAAQPAFTTASLRVVSDRMADAVEDMLERWKSVDGSPRVIDVSVEMMHLALDIAMRALFGTRLPPETAAVVYEAVTSFLKSVDRRLWSAVSAPLWVPTASNRAFQRAIRTIEGVFADVIANRRKGSGDATDFFGLIVQEYGDGPEGRGMIRDIGVSMLLAAHETTAAALTWSCYLLSRYPEWRRRVRLEAAGRPGGREPLFDDLGHLPYARAVFDETIRLYPSIWTFSREACADDRLGDTHIPAGATVMLCPYAMHRSPIYWDNPEGFDPERFMSKANGVRAKYAYFPFGGGPRTCIGARFAVTEAMIALPRIVGRYDLDLVPGQVVEPEPMITLRPRNGVLMTATPIQPKQGTIP